MSEVRTVIVRHCSSLIVNLDLYYLFLFELQLDGALSTGEADSGHTTAVVPSTHMGRITQLVIYICIMALQ